METLKSETENAIHAALGTLKDRYLEQNLSADSLVKKLIITEGRVHLKLCLGYPAKRYQDELKETILKALSSIPQVSEVTLDLEWKIRAHAVQKGLKGIPGVKNIIAVASGKGGVGKSTVASNLALALMVEGARVGILDADIYGPSLPRMLGKAEQPRVADGKRMVPVISHGLQTNSMGYLIEEDTPMVWRGPMATSALTQLSLETDWQDLDYLIVDLPPGTGDIQLTLAQKIPVSGAVIVTTPQDIALLDAKKALNMFRKLNVPVLGVIENMSYHICSNCKHEDLIFGSKGGEQMSLQYDVALLGKIPLDRSIREQADLGQPLVVAKPLDKVATIYREIAVKMAARLSLQPRDYQAAFPTVVIQN